jgi:outer membrane protein OmpA-like peptidoglycan-associated protein
MKLRHANKNKSHGVWFIYKKKARSALLITLILIGAVAPVMSQDTEAKQTKPSWWFGAAVGANFNFYQGSTQELNADFTPPVPFHDGFGIGLFLAPTIEYYRPNTRLGMMLQFGYDGRIGKFDQMYTPCDCPQDLSAKLNYITIEPSLRFAPFRNNFYMFAGPRFAFNLDKSFVYQLSINPAYPDQTPSPEVNGDFSNVNELLVSMQIGAGVDIPISSQENRTQFVLSPFVSFHPYFGQDPRSIETWNTTTLRAGVAFKFGVAGKSSEKDPKDEDVVIAPVKLKEKEKEDVLKVEFIVISPKNIPAERTVRETFPLRNYVFFDLGSTDIPQRYVTLEKSEVKGFKEDQVELFTPENLSGRSKRQLVVYYNILNILGDRMVENPSSNIKLVGSSELSPADGRKMAESIKTYLVDVFSIAPSRITTEGRDSPKIPSRQVGGTKELVLLSEGDRRVSIESNSPILLMEFQSGPSAPLKPVNILVVEEAPIESYVSLENKNAKENFTSWIIEVKDDKGIVQTFGPYTEDKVTIPGKDILGTNAKGNFKVKMIGTTTAGKKHEKETEVQMVLWVPAKTEVAMRFSVIYEFNESKAIGIYDKYLTEIVVNKIPKNGKVIIHGHTDIIGDPNYNEKLSLQRANDVKKIMESALAKQGRKDVKFEVMGFGEDQKLAPFENRYPEERFYNRTVLIDIIPAK